MPSSINKLPNIEGYQLLQDWSTSGSCRWSFAEKDGKQWFIKQFMAPKLKRTSDGISEKKVKESRKRCVEFSEAQHELYSRIAVSSETGNIVPVSRFFLHETMFYSVTSRIDISSVEADEISHMSHDQKMVLLKVLTHSICSLHKNGVVHADLKPDNVLIKETQSGYTLKLIDFDASFLESKPKRGEQVCFDMSFVAPETIAAYNDERISLTKKIDVFALGLLIHLYYSGVMPWVPDCYSNVCGAVSDQCAPRVSKKIPEWMKKMILDMLSLLPENRPDSKTVFQALTAQRYPLQIDLSVDNETKGFYSPLKLSKHRTNH